MRFPSFLFILYIHLAYVLNFESKRPNCHILFLLKYTFLCDEHIFCKFLLPCASNLLLSHWQCFLAHLVTWCVTSFWFFLMCTFSCLNHIFWLSLFLLMSVQSLSYQQCLLPHPTHHHKHHLPTAGNPATQQNNTSHLQAMPPPYCPPAASHFPH